MSISCVPKGLKMLLVKEIGSDAELLDQKMIDFSPFSCAMIFPMYGSGTV